MKFKTKSAIVTSLLSGALVFFGAFTSGNVSWTSLVAAVATSMIIAITKYKDFWSKQEELERGDLYSFL